MNDKNNARIITAAVLAAPVATMALVRILLGDPVTQASANFRALDPLASSQKLTADAELAATDKLSAQQLRLIASGMMWAPLSDETASPMLEQVAYVPEPEAKPKEEPDPQLEISSVMGAGDRAFASINGRVYRLGDTVATGWILEAIDAPARRVTIRREHDGRQIDLPIGR